MKWELLDNPAPGEAKELEAEFRRAHGFNYHKKPKYFVDESLGEGTLEVLREMKVSALGVWETKLVGHPDENIFRFCQKEQRILLSHDGDFLDKKKFPLRKCFGVVILPGAEGEESVQLVNMVKFLWVCGGAGFMYETKIRIQKNGIWERWYLGDKGAIYGDTFRLESGGRVSVLVE